MELKDQRLIERGFPCHQVGAETQRERDTGQAPPPNRLHVWWARRPLTPSRAAIVASLDPADTHPETFVRQLGIERVEALVNGALWTLNGDLSRRVERDGAGSEYLVVDALVLRRLQVEKENRLENQRLISGILERDPGLISDPVLDRWKTESQPFPEPWPEEGEILPVTRVMGDPAWAKQKMSFTASHGIRFPGDPYGYDRAFLVSPPRSFSEVTILDPTAGGGSIPFEGLRLGYKVIANELNPVATAILWATLKYPVEFGTSLADDIIHWGNKLISSSSRQLADVFFDGSPLLKEEASKLASVTVHCPEFYERFNKEQVVDYIFVRQVTCPSCRGEAPLLNTCWLSKEAADPWGVKVETDGQQQGGKISFAPYRVQKGKGPRGDDPNFSTVNRGIGQCIHCRQAIPGKEIKAQARGESPHGCWTDRLYCVVAVRLEPKLDKDGRPQRYASGPQKGEIKTRKIRFFRSPNEGDLKALEMAEQQLRDKWDDWEAAGLIPTENIPEDSNYNRGHRLYGIYRWCDMFTPRQLLGHLFLIEGLNRLKPQILAALGPERGRAVVTYLQFAIDKGLDYNSKQTRWHYSRGVLINTFGSHNFSLKWTFGEMIFTGPNSGAAWGLSQVSDAYRGIADLLAAVHDRVGTSSRLPLTILNGTAAHMHQIADKSVDLVCMDPPYYNNVQYAELSDYFYVWQRRTLKDLYPDIFHRRLTNKTEEAVANPMRDGSAREASKTYERMMLTIFSECRRVLKDGGIMTIMFTHKSQDAWETLTRSLIEAGWTLTSSFPVESEASNSIHQMDMAAAASSIFITCRKREAAQSSPALWTGFGGTGVQRLITETVKNALAEFEPLKLNAVDEMVACYGKALHVLSQHWPVMDGDEPVGPMRAMLEASRVVAENQVSRITNGRLSVRDLDTETGMGLTLFGIYGLNAFPYDEALNISKSLNVALASKSAGYRVEGQMIGINQEAAGGSGRSRGAMEQEHGYHAPLVRSGSKLRLTRPEERDQRRLDQPQTDWDLLHGLIQAHRKGDAIVARGYLKTHAGENSQRILDLLDVWVTEVGDEKLKKEAETIRFDLNPGAGRQR